MFLHVLVHFGYTLQLLALLARDVLWLRSILVVAQTVLATYAYLRGPEYMPYVFWNALFVGINVFWVARLLRERAEVTLPDELLPIYVQSFAALSPPEFLRLWREGERKAGAAGQQLVREGTRPEALYLILSGAVDVRHQDRAVTRLSAGNFVAEMSLLTGEKTTADVFAAGPVEYMAWPLPRLDRLRARNPMLWSKIQSALGHDLVEKIKRAAVAQGA